jgi:carboxymethylenebutenolidase
MQPLFQEQQGVPDDRFIGDAEGSATFLSRLPYHSGKTGIIGFCSGGRQTYLAAGRMNSVDAAVQNLSLP